MAAELVDDEEVISCLQCHVYKRSHAITLKENAKVFRSPNNSYIASHDANNCLCISKLVEFPSEGVSTFTVSNITSFVWKPGDTGMYTVDFEKNITDQSFSGNPPKVLTQCSFNNIQREITSKVPEIVSIESLSIVHSVSSTCLLMVNKSAFVSILLDSDGRCKYIAKLAIPGLPQSSPPSFQIVSDQLLLLAVHCCTLYMFDFVNGYVWNQIDLHSSKLDFTTRMLWRVSPDFHKLVLIGPDWMLHTLSLDAYVDAYPRSLKVDPHCAHPYTSRSFLPSHSTCHLGDNQWRQTLLSLHEQQHLLSESGGETLTPGRHQHCPRKKARVTGFHTISPRREYIMNESVIDSRELPMELQEFSIRDMVLGKFAVTLSLDNNQGKKALCVIDATHHKLLFKSISGSQEIVLSTSSGHPHLVLSDVYVFHIITEATVEREDLVSKMMLYGGASAADKLCDVNKWGHCTVPVNSLQIGIQHRQLDTVAFFLKSKENLFTANKQKPSISPSAAAVEESSLWASHNRHADSVKQLDSALKMLVKAVQENIRDQQSRDFAHKLLTLTLEFLYGLVHNGLSVHASLDSTETVERSDLESAFDFLMGYVAQLRLWMTLPDQGQVQGRTKLIIPKSSLHEDVMDGNIKTPVWSYLQPEEAVEAATLNSELPLLQSHLLTTGNPGGARYQHLVSCGMHQVLVYIHHKDLKSAKTLIANMGFNVSSKLWELAEVMRLRDLQMFLLTELHTSGHLSPEQVSQVTFLHDLYSLYPCGSFSQAMLERSAQSDSAWSDENIIASLLTKTSCEEDSVCGDIGQQDSSQDGPYAEVLLAWLKWWDEEARERILLEGMFAKDDMILELYPNRKLLWRYLLSHNRHEDALTLLDLMIREVTEDGGSSRQRQEGIADLYNDLELCPQYMQMVITHKLMRKGFIKKDTLFDLDALTRDLSHVGGVLCTPHPLHYMDRPTQDRFHQYFLSYCTSHQLVLPLWRYCHKHRLRLDQVEMESEDMRNWLIHLQHFCTIPRCPDDTDAIFHASLSCAALIWKIPKPTIAALFKHDHVTAAIATLPYSPTPIQQMSDIGKLEMFEDIDQDVLQTRLADFPKLYAALFPTGSVDTPRTDVNVYQLLMGSASLDPRRLFGWQDGDTIAAEDGLQSLPYFSKPELVAECAYTEKIRYTYYLKHGRPTYAFLSFLAEEVDSGATTISTKRIHTICGVALWIAVKNYTNPSITSACVAFVEMMGQDSLLLRVYIHAGLDILAVRNCGIVGSCDRKKEAFHGNQAEVLELLLSCVRHRRRNGARLVEALERATMDTIIRKGIDGASFEAANHWLLTMTACHQLLLPLSSCFLEQCASADKWLPFLWFAQLHQFPKQQLQGLLHQFHSRHLRDHLHYVIENADAKSMLSRRKSSQDQTDSSAAPRDARSSLYAKIGLTKGKDDTGDTSSDEDSSMTVLYPRCDGLHTHDDVSVEAVLTEDSAPDDVFQVVFSSQMSVTPWKTLLHASVILRNSLFAELAACHQDVPITPCLCGWLVAMMDRTEHAQFLGAHGKASSTWNMPELELLINIYMQQNWEWTLATGFDIFQMNSPLLPFLKFIAELVQGRNYATCINLLGEFKDAMSNYNQEKTQDSSLQPVLGNSYWLEQTANRLLNYRLLHCNNLYEALRLVELLDQENIALVFSFDVPDYSQLHKLIKILHSNNLAAIAIPAFLNPKDEAFRTESVKAVNMLVEMKSFSAAYKLARLTDISCDRITLKEMSAEKAVLQETLFWRSKVARSRFWKMCSEKFKLNQVSKDSLVQFYNEEVEEVPDMSEKGLIYELCLRLLSGRDGADDLYNHVYRQMWHCRIQAKLRQQTDEQTGEREEEEREEDVGEEEAEEPMEEILSVMDATDDRKSSADKSELINPGRMPIKTRQSQVSLDELDACNALIGQLLDECKIRESCQVTSTFQHYSQDLAIILTCIQLSQGAIGRDRLEPEMLRLLSVDRRASVRASVGSFSPFPRTTSSISLAPTSPSWDFLPVDKEDAINMMELLLGHCNHGQQCCLRIITAFKAACVLELDYKDVVNREEFSVLDDLLRTTFPQKFTLARDFLSTSSLTDNQVANFLSVAIIKALKVFLNGEPGQGAHSFSSKDPMFNTTEGTAMFDHFIKLCQDPSHLGHHLLEAAAVMGDNSDDPQSARQALSLQTELLILAHQCHTVACSMEGISHVLRAARVCTDNLAKADEFAVMIRLLTGVGRFSEMTYIFDALKHHHQFELLLRKGMEREDNLKTAVLDYLKRFHPADKDSYTMVALKFTMYREIAHMLEENGWRQLNTLKNKPLENTRDVQESLKKCAQYFSDAAESYVKDNCLRHAQQCLRQARLIALQIQHLSSGVQVIHLSPEGVVSLITEHPKFLESLIVSEAYGKQATWSDAIYHNVIVNGDFRYLHDLKSHIRLSATIIQDAAAKFQQSGNTSTQALTNIRKLLPFCKDVRIQYRIAEDLQLSDVITSMLKSDCGSYLQDIMSLS